MKDITVNLTPNEASGEAYWRKRCDVVEAELSRLRAENKALQADAELVRAVRNFKDHQGIRKSGPFFVCQDYDGDYDECDTPEAALKAAGLMEVKG